MELLPHLKMVGNNDNDDYDTYNLLWGFNDITYVKHLVQCLVRIKVSIDVKYYNYYVYITAKCSYISQPRNYRSSISYNEFWWLFGKNKKKGN